jgi:hypothetical protein
MSPVLVSAACIQENYEAVSVFIAAADLLVDENVV